MEFGMFMEFQTRPEGTPGSAFAEGFDLVLAAEAWGLDTAWLAEFHFNPTRSVLSSPINVASAIAAQTQRIRIGMAVYVLPLNNPLRIAEEIATVDHISGGRFELGVGRSGFTRFYDTYGISYDESRERFNETMEILRKAGSGEPFDHDGEYFQFNEVAVFPPAVQQPHPPLRIAAATPETFVQVGRQGLPIFVGLRGDGMSELANSLNDYRQAWREAGHPGNGSAFLRVPVYAGTTEKTAHDIGRETFTYYFSRQAKMVAADAERRTDPAERAKREEMANMLANLTYEDILKYRVAAGAPDGLTARLTELQEVLGLDGIVAEMNAGGMLNPDQVKDSLRVLTQQVMPNFR